MPMLRMADKPFDKPFGKLTALSEVEGRPWHPLSALQPQASGLKQNCRLGRAKRNPTILSALRLFARRA